LPAAKHAELGPPRRLPSRLVGLCGPVALPTSVPSDFQADRRDGPMKAPGNASKTLTGGDPARDLLAFTQAKNSSRTGTLHGRDAASGLKYTIKVAGSLA
jgi:hypothetical protein